MTSKRLGATAVLDVNGNLLGIITDGDLRRMLTKEDIDFQNITAKNILSPNPKSIVMDALAVEALEKMRQASITQLVVINDENERKYLGMVHLHDLLREGLI
jgi:arabinose-5-phosphate isomerase